MKLNRTQINAVATEVAKRREAEKERIKKSIDVSGVTLTAVEEKKILKEKLEEKIKKYRSEQLQKLYNKNTYPYYIKEEVELALIEAEDLKELFKKLV